MTVHVLTINHRHGTDAFVCATEGVALARLDAYVTEWWDTELPDNAMPDDSQSRIDEYFEALSDRGGNEEYYSIEELEVLHQ